jgi:hypothetical protein
MREPKRNRPLVLLILMVCLPIALVDRSQFVAPFCYGMVGFSVVWLFVHRQRGALDDRPPSP